MKLSTEHSVTPGHRYALFYVFMQTHDRPVLGTSLSRIGHCTSVATVLALLTMTASCSPIHLEAINTQHSRSTCETAHDSAVQTSLLASDSAHPVLRRYLAADQASRQWTLVAVDCSQRFAEGTLRSAQTHWQQSTLARVLGKTFDDAHSVSGLPALDGLQTADEDSSVWSALSLAEDRAGFAMEVLAAHHQDSAMLAVSDQHKTTAQSLFSISGSSQDPRLKVYDTSQLVKHPERISDPATGWSVPTPALVEIDCAREELAAMPSADTSAESGESNDATKGTRHLRVVSQLIAQRAYTAFSYGYPNIDVGLFLPTVATATQ